MYVQVTAAQIARSVLQLCSTDRCQTPVVEEVYNKSTSLIAWVSGQYVWRDIALMCSIFPRLWLRKILRTLVQYLAILTANPCNKVNMYM